MEKWCRYTTYIETMQYSLEETYLLNVGDSLTVVMTEVKLLVIIESKREEDLAEKLKNRRNCNWLERMIQHSNCFGVQRANAANLGYGEWYTKVLLSLLSLGKCGNQTLPPCAVSE